MKTSVAILSISLVAPLLFGQSSTSDFMEEAHRNFERDSEAMERQMQNDVVAQRLWQLEQDRAATNRQVIVVPEPTEPLPDYNPEAAVAAGIKPSLPPLLDKRDPANSRYNALLTERYKNALARYNEQQATIAAEEKNRRIEKILQETSNSRPIPSAPPLRQTLEQKEIAKRARFSNDVAFSKEEAIRLYPYAAVSTSELCRKTTEIANRLESEKNPIVVSANAPLLLTEMAAKELGIQPKR